MLDINDERTDTTVDNKVEPCRFKVRDNAFANEGGTGSNLTWLNEHILLAKTFIARSCSTTYI